MFLPVSFTVIAMIIEANNPLEPGEFFMLPDKKYAVVQCAHFRCLAYRLPDGRWKMADGDEELADATQVSGFF